MISTIAGGWPAGYSGDGGPATSAQLNIPWGIAVDGPGNLYIADLGNAVVRRVTGGARCGIALDATSRVLDAGAANGVVNINPALGCGYTAAADNPWIHVNGGAASSGAGALQYTVDTNLGTSSRSGKITISVPGAVASLYVYQSGAGCQFALVPSLVSVDASGLYGSVQISQNNAGCAAFQLTSDSPWLTITGPPIYAGGNSIPYRVLNNPGAQRTARISASTGQSHTVIQAAAPVSVLGPLTGSTLVGNAPVPFNWSTSGSDFFRTRLEVLTGAGEHRVGDNLQFFGNRRRAA